MPFIAFIFFVSVHIFEYKYYCSFLLLNLGLHSHMPVLNYRKNLKTQISKLSKWKGRWVRVLRQPDCHWEGSGPLRRAQEVVHILFARVLLLSAPDCLNTGNCQWKFAFSIFNIFKYHVFAPMGRFQLELIYLYFYFPPSGRRWKIKVN